MTDAFYCGGLNNSRINPITGSIHSFISTLVYYYYGQVTNFCNSRSFQFRFCTYIRAISMYIGFAHDIL